LQNPGASSVNLGSAARREAQEEASTPLWEGMAALGSMQGSGSSFASRGHFVDARPATVLVNALAAAPYAARRSADGQRFPVGALLVQQHAGGRGDEAGPLFVMRKRERGYFEAGGDWDYAVVQPQGALEAQGQLPLCARCHAEAPSAWVFGGTGSQ